MRRTVGVVRRGAAARDWRGVGSDKPDFAAGAGHEQGVGDLQAAQVSVRSGAEVDVEALQPGDVLHDARNLRGEQAGAG